MAARVLCLALWALVGTSSAQRLVVTRSRHAPFAEDHWRFLWSAPDLQRLSVDGCSWPLPSTAPGLLVTSGCPWPLPACGAGEVAWLHGVLLEGIRTADVLLWRFSWEDVVCECSRSWYTLSVRCGDAPPVARQHTYATPHFNLSVRLSAQAGGEAVLRVVDWTTTTGELAVTLSAASGSRRSCALTSSTAYLLLGVRVELGANRTLEWASARELLREVPDETLCLVAPSDGAWVDAGDWHREPGSLVWLSRTTQQLAQCRAGLAPVLQARWFGSVRVLAAGVETSWRYRLRAPLDDARDFGEGLEQPVSCSADDECV